MLRPRGRYRHGAGTLGGGCNKNMAESHDQKWERMLAGVFTTVVALVLSFGCGDAFAGLLIADPGRNLWLMDPGVLPHRP